jgi:hypothetical protein
VTVKIIDPGNSTYCIGVITVRQLRVGGIVGRKIVVKVIPAVVSKATQRKIGTSGVHSDEHHSLEARTCPTNI